MYKLNPINAGSSVSFTLEFLRNGVDIVPTSISYKIHRINKANYYNMITVYEGTVTTMANVVEILIPSEQTIWDERYTEDLLIEITWYDESHNKWVEWVKTEITRTPFFKNR